MKNSKTFLDHTLIQTILRLDHTSSFICEDDKFKCASQRCIAKEWRCDGDDDCGDGSDEIDCMEPKQCLSDIEFRCDNKLKCIPLRWKCDHERDCNDGSDEVNCSKFSSH